MSPPARIPWRFIWFIGSMAVLIMVTLIVTSELPCFWRNGLGCSDMAGHQLAIGLLALAALTSTVLAFRAWKAYPSPTLPEPFTWWSTYALPLSFILFFVLAGVFLGEQLPALHTYLGDITRPDNKPSVLDVGGPGDTGVVFVIYTAFGMILWLLFRLLNWRIVWLAGVVIGLLAEWFLFAGKPDNLTLAGNPIGSTIFLVIVWSVISMVPYAVFRSVDRRWGARGRWLAIGIILLLNIIATGFFAYEKFVLHREYVNPQRGQEMVQGTPTGPMNSSSDAGSTQTLPSLASFREHPSDQFLVDMDVVATGHPFKGQRAAEPHAGAHVQFGDDYKSWPRGGTGPSNYPPIYAAADGTIDIVDTKVPVAPNDRYGISLAIAKDGNTTWDLDYGIEPMVPEPSAGFYAIHHGQAG